MDSEQSRISKAREAFEKASTEMDHIKHLIGPRDSTTHNITMSAWKIQSHLEYAIALLKLHLKSEEPISRIKKDVIPTEIVPMETILETSNYLESTLKKIKNRDYSICIAEAREARNTLRKMIRYYRKNRCL